MKWPQSMMVFVWRYILKMHLFFGYASQKSTFMKKELFCFCFFSQNQMSKMKNEDNWYKMKWSELKNELDSKNMDWIKDVLLVNFIVETLPIHIYILLHIVETGLCTYIFFFKSTWKARPQRNAYNNMYSTANVMEATRWCGDITIWHSSFNMQIINFRRRRKRRTNHLSLLLLLLLLFAEYIYSFTPRSVASRRYNHKIPLILTPNYVILRLCWYFCSIERKIKKKKQNQQNCEIKRKWWFETFTKGIIIIYSCKTSNWFIFSHSIHSLCSKRMAFKS